MFEKMPLTKVVHAAAWGTKKPFDDLGEHNSVGRKCNGLEQVVSSLPFPRERPMTIVEIGAELGGSSRFFLKHFPNAALVSIDPWVGNYPLPKDWQYLKNYTAHIGGSLYDIYRSFCWDYRDRLLPMVAWSQDGLVAAYNMRLKPDLIFIDGDHRYHGVYADLVTATTLFPEATIVGDDWNFNPTIEKYKGIEFPVQKAAVDFCAHFERTHRQIGNTFVLE